MWGWRLEGGVWGEEEGTGRRVGGVGGVWGVV